jgi:NTP pyrophosphatase (non-canonical NTP hydrolase)
MVKENNMNNVDLNRYSEFVASVTSNESNDFEFFSNRLNYLNSQHQDLNISLLLTSAVGMCSESGEFIEIVKKVIFQGKELTDENVFHLKREIGDIFFYIINACRALGVDPNEAIKENVNKLINRYPAGKFDVHYSENRQDGDL